MSGPVLLLGAGSAAAGAEFQLARIAAACPVVLVDATAPGWARPYLAKHLVADLTDHVATLKAVKEHAARYEVRGVLAYSPEHLVTAAHTAARLGLPAPSVASLVALRDTVQLRRLLARHRVPQPRWAEAMDAEAAVAHADVIGYPVLVRPRSGGRTGPVAARDAGEVRAAVERLGRDVPAAANPHGSVVVEEYLEGLHLSAETVVLPDGEAHVVAVARTSFGPMPGRQPLRHSVHAHDGLLHNPVLRNTVGRAVDAVGVQPGVLHISVTSTPRGPRVTGVQAQPADDLIPLLVRRATGIDLPRIAAHLAIGRTPDLAPVRQRAAAVHFAYAPVSGRVERLTVSPRASRQPSLEELKLLQEEGNRVESVARATADDRLAHWVVLGSDASDCHSTLDEVSRLFSPEIVAPSAVVT
ncbi:hypothetical protein [Streptomyces sp. NPDC005435]|uniref:ATP-grasp domain-containing protein n=1 Tax=Streptomyces sp. NPDC005435 TaxID=3154464 RepID=UPI003456BA3C